MRPVGAISGRDLDSGERILRGAGHRPRACEPGSRIGFGEGKKCRSGAWKRRIQPERRKRSLRQGGRDRRAAASPSPSAASGDGNQSGEAGCLTPFVPPCRAEASQRDAPTWPLPALESGFRVGSRAGKRIASIRCSTDSSNPSQSRNWIRFKSDQGPFHWCSSTIPRRAAIFCE